MTNKLIQINLFTDHVKRQSGLDVKVELPVCESEAGKIQLKKVEDAIENLCNEITILFNEHKDSFTMRGCDDTNPNDDINEMLQDAKEFGKFANLAMKHFGDKMTDEQKQSFEEMQVLSELANAIDKFIKK